MTVPIIGSGISNAFRAAKILADTVIADKTETYSAETLWDYEYNYQTKIGFPLSSLALVKLLLVRLTTEQLDYLFESKIITIKELQVSDEPGGSPIDINSQLIEKASALIKNKKLLSLILGLGKDMALLAGVNKTLPKHYSRRSVQAWAKRYDGVFNTEAEK
jgi:flavin-dependent dehydrogenase